MTNATEKKPKNIHHFPIGGAIQFARRKAIKGHRYWMIWFTDDGDQYASRATAEHLEYALNTAREFMSITVAPSTTIAPEIYLIAATDGTTERYSRPGYLAILENMRNGHFAG